MIEEIGRGAEGSVWRGRWHHIDVAVKEVQGELGGWELDDTGYGKRAAVNTNCGECRARKGGTGCGG